MEQGSTSRAEQGSTSRSDFRMVRQIPGQRPSIHQTLTAKAAGRRPREPTQVCDGAAMVKSKRAPNMDDRGVGTGVGIQGTVHDHGLRQGLLFKSPDGSRLHKALARSFIQKSRPTPCTGTDQSLLFKSPGRLPSQSR